MLRLNSGMGQEFIEQERKLRKLPQQHDANDLADLVGIFQGLTASRVGLR